jgi:hypothetical protein
MDRPTISEAARVVEYFRLEAPWELERLESLDALVHSWLDWAAAGSDGSLPAASYSSWLRSTYGIFRRPVLT